MPRQAKSTSAAFTVSVPPPPPSPTSASDLTAVSVPCCVSGATSCAGNSSSAFASGPEHGASRSPTSVAPALVDQNSQNELFRGFLAFMRSQEVVSTAASSLASVQSDSGTRLVYSSAPSDRPFSAVGTPPGPPTLPAPVRGSGAGGGGGGWGQQGRPPHRGLTSFVPARLPYAGVFPIGREEDRSWGAPPFWGDFGGRAPTAVGDQSYLGSVYGEYSYPSDPYRPHTLEQPPPSDFGPEYDILDPFASPEDDFSGDVDNYRRVDPRVVYKEARSLLFKYMGDLYRDATDIFGEPLQRFNGAGSELGGWTSAPYTGLFTDAPRRRSGINLPSEFATEYSRMD